MSDTTTTNAPSELIVVGSKLWFVPNERRGNPKLVEVTSVGRKWIGISKFGGRPDGRVNRETMLVDGGGYGSPARCYRTKEEWENEAAASDAWCKLRDAVSRRPRPEALTAKQIDDIRFSLFHGTDETPP